MSLYFLTNPNPGQSDENKLEIVKSGAVPALISLSQNSDMIVASQACGCLANLAEVKSNQGDTDNAPFGLLPNNKVPDVFVPFCYTMGPYRV